MPYDIAIIGAGPAGATLARLLDKQYKVLLLDKRDLMEPGGRRDQNAVAGFLPRTPRRCWARWDWQYPQMCWLILSFSCENH